MTKAAELRLPRADHLRRELYMLNNNLSYADPYLRHDKLGITVEDFAFDRFHLTSYATTNELLTSLSGMCKY